MDVLFPLKNDIPDNNIENFRTGYFYFLNKRAIICFLISYEENETIKIDNQYNKEYNKVYHLGKIDLNQKSIFIDYIELFYSNNDDLKIEINNKSYFIEKNKYNDNEKCFLFNKFLYENKENKRKLNCFNINEEFEIYYKIHFEKNNN